MRIWFRNEEMRVQGITAPQAISERRNPWAVTADAGLLTAY
jgi:hypothetical protein